MSVGVVFINKTGADMSTSNEQDFFERVYAVVQQIPRGKVATYGDIAAVVGGGCDARFVGQALGALGGGKRALQVPWQRIVSRGGTLSTSGPRQRALLETEGIVFDERGRIPMERYGWEGPEEAWATKHGFQPVRLREVEKPSPQLNLL
jgi:methylated-DNA-protein-cysteine methyltransferase-like protein